MRNGGMSGLATCEILRREFEVHGDRRFERLAGLSRSHLNNLRAARVARVPDEADDVGEDAPGPVAIGARKAPEPNGRPGFLPADTQTGLRAAKGLNRVRDELFHKIPRRRRDPAPGMPQQRPLPAFRRRKRSATAFAATSCDGALKPSCCPQSNEAPARFGNTCEGPVHAHDLFIGTLLACEVRAFWNNKAALSGKISWWATRRSGTH